LSTEAARGQTALLVGNSSGIGLALTRRLLELDWTVLGISRSDSPVTHQSYRHERVCVQDPGYPQKLAVLLAGNGPELCVYCAGIGEELDLERMEQEVETVDVNLLGMIKTVAVVVPPMVGRGSGHFIGLSSIADGALSSAAPSYYASKAGFTRYLECLAPALRRRGVYVTNVRFGFVDTKMAKGSHKPLMMTPERAAEHLLDCIERRPVSYTAPRVMGLAVRLRRWLTRLEMFLLGPAHVR
jgi:short-subunit dehydrogenase